MNLRKFIVLAPLGLFALSFGLRFYALGQTEFANGWDAYFYLVQLKSMVEDGVMHSPDNALIYPFLKFLFFLTGNYVLSFKLGAAALAGFFTLAVFQLGKRWGPSLSLAFLAASWTVFSPHLTYFAAQYPKNLLGIVLFIFLLSYWKWPVRFSGMVILVANYFGHKLTFGLSLIYVFLNVAFAKMRLRWLAVLILAGFGLLCLVSLLPGGAPFALSERFSGMTSSVAQFAPLSFFNSFGPELVSGFWRFEIWTAVVLFGLVSFWEAVKYFLVKASNVEAWALVVLAAFLLFPFWAWSLTGFAYRFFLVFVLLTPLWLILFGRLTGKVAWCCSLALIFLSVFSWKAYNPAKHDPPYALYQRISQEAKQILSDHPVELVIAHNSLAEFFTFSIGIDGMPWRPDYEIPNDRLWRLATGIKEQAFRHYLPEGELSYLKKVTRTYFLVREDVWQRFLKAVETDDPEFYDELKTWRNPHRIRPSFLRK